METLPNKGVELTAYSVRSCLAPASSRSSRLALGFGTEWKEQPTCVGTKVAFRFSAPPPEENGTDAPKGDEVRVA
jgi:hypothetical protein